jgi:Fe-S cluster assembly protein SufD
MINLIKKNSLEFFNSKGLPSKKLENWKFTSSKKFKKFSKSSLCLDGKPKIESDELSIVFVNGVLDKDSLKNFKFSHFLEVKNLNEVNDKQLLHCSENFLNESMFNLGISEFEDGSYVTFKKNSVIEEIINIKNYFFEDEVNKRVSSFNIFHINEGSEISIMEEDIKNGHSTLNLKLNKFICENSSVLKYGKSCNEDLETYSLSYNYYQIGENVTLSIDSIVKSSFFNKDFIEVDLDNVGSDAKINILNLGKEEQHVDNNILINHNAEHCTSFQHVRNVLDNKSTAVFNGKVIVSEGAQQTDSNQSNKNLLLSLESNAFSNPQLEIYADDVSCGHGSTTGALDENSIFYLRARGIDYSSAQKILIKAFAKEVIEDFSLSSLQDISEIALDSWIDG